MNAGALFIATFLACLVEAVEATTIVLAAGTSRDWRSAFKGVRAGLAVLIVAVAIAGPAVTLLPLGALRIVVGGLLLVFGLQWIRKAVLRASGRRPLHDETAIFAKQVAKARSEAVESRGAVKDWYAFTLAFKGVVLEGLEVVFIVLTFGANASNVGLAALAALAAIVVVVILGAAVRGPLSRVPENTLKFIVGIMLTAFGVFWAGEGAGAVWPGSDLALLVLAPAIAVFSLLLVAVLRRKRDGGAEKAMAAAQTPAPAATPEPESSAAPSGAALVKTRPTVQARVKSFGLFWYDFIFGDDWQVALLIAIAIALTAIVAIGGASIAWLAIVVVVAATLPYSIHRALR
ncbi:MAG: hypothetical protein QOE21_661 [Microbacteriaceae bacterium]|nr:hypothetical protein [Microbacteriaceae bacterium]